MDRIKTSTRKIYCSAWKKFNEFFIRLDRKPDTWEERIILFVGFLIEQKKQSQTIRSYLSALRAVLRDDGVTLNENRFLLSALTKACKYKNDQVRTRMPIQKSMLKVILARVKQHYYTERGQPYLAILYSTLFSTAYFGLFRVGELTAGSHPVMVKDVHLARNKKKFLFILRTSKTHGKHNFPQTVKITASGNMSQVHCLFESQDEQYCPFRLLRDYVACRPHYKSLEEPFFIFRDWSPVKPEDMRKTLKSMIQLCNLDQNLYDTHSFRAGRSVDLLKMGIEISLLKKIGRWKSNIVYSYFKGI